MLEKGADEFTANSIFWIVILIGLVFYTALVLLGVSLFDLYKRLRNKNNSNKLDIQTDIDEQVINPRDTTEINSSENIKVLEENNIDTNEIVKFNIRKKFNKKTKNYK
jgi:Na+(H+)/acetate symporter ActP